MESSLTLAAVWRRWFNTPPSHTLQHQNNLELMYFSDYCYDSDASDDLSNLMPLESPMLRIRISGDQDHAPPGVPTAPPIDFFTTQSLFLPAVPSLAHKDPVPKDVKRAAKSRL